MRDRATLEAALDTVARALSEPGFECLAVLFERLERELEEVERQTSALDRARNRARRRAA